jgi:cytochrome c-type biogenesis protein CcmH
MAMGLQPSAAGAVEPDELLNDPALEARARALSAEIRCLVCQNQSIDDSDAELAREIRLLVRERLAAGDDEPEIKAYLVSRYGDFVLFRPPVVPSTYLLWFGPFVLMLLGVAAVAFYLRAQGRRRAKVTESALSEAEVTELQSLLEEIPPAESASEDDGKRSS